MIIENKEIADRCRAALEKAGIKHKDLAVRIKKSGATVSDYLSGDVKIPVTVVAVISEMTGVTPNALIADLPGQYPIGSDRNVEAQVNDSTETFQAGPLKISRQEEELIYLLREIPTDMQPLALEGVRNVWVMARRKRETSQDSE